MWAAHLRAALPGGIVAVHRYWDEAKKNSIDIFTHQNGEGIVAATIGLMDLDQSRDRSRPIFTEILLDARKSDDRVANIVSTAGFYTIKNGWRLAPGVVYEGLVHMYLPQAQVKHLLFVPPFQWDDNTMTAVDLGNITVHPLLAVPITDSELQYVRRNGSEAIQDLWEKSRSDVLDLNRGGAA
jgi:hypothetical protein